MKPETLYGIIADWWGDAETQDKDPVIADLVDDIEKWLPNGTPNSKQKLRQKQTVKFVSVARTIDPRTGVHYLDAIDENGMHWMASMEDKTENWLYYHELWYQDPQQPKTYD
ncbi:MAG: hypothetical protein ACO24H_08495 [Polynucleobacter sp.]